MTTLAVVLATAVACAPVSVHTSAKFLTEASKKPLQTILIAQKYGGDPHGDDPHGDDPHDETHDDNMKANEDRSFDKAPKDVYGGLVPNSQAPY